MSIKEPTVSVVMATYNGERYLAEQLDTIENQTRKPDEVIIVDDCSTDNTWDCLSQYAQTRSWVKLFRNDVNLGVNANFLKAIQLSTGDLIFCSDQDDVWKQDKIEVFIKEWAGEDLLFSNGEIINSAGELINASELAFHDDCEVVEKSDPWFFYRANCASGHNLMLTRRLIDRFGVVPEKVMYDQWFALVVSLHGKLKYLDKVACSHRIHDSNTCNNPELRSNSKLRRELGYSKSDWIRLKRQQELQYLKSIRSVGGLDNQTNREFFNFLDVMIRHLSGQGSDYFDFELRKLQNQYADRLFFQKNSESHRARVIWNRSLGDRLLWLTR